MAYEFVSKDSEVGLFDMQRMRSMHVYHIGTTDDSTTALQHSMQKVTASWHLLMSTCTMHHQEVQYRPGKVVISAAVDP